MSNTGDIVMEMCFIGETAIIKSEKNELKIKYQEVTKAIRKKNCQGAPEIWIIKMQI